MRQNINMISLGVKDMEQSKTFYENGLGWTASDRSKAAYRLYDLGSFFLGLYPLDTFEKDVGLPFVETAFKGFSLSFNAISIEEVNSILEKVAMHGGEIVKAGENVSWGGYRGYFKDVDDYLFEVVYNPFWTLDDNQKLVL